MPSRTSWKIGLALLTLVAVTVWWILLVARDQGFHVYVLDIGQGDSILVKRGSFEMLVDGGPNASVIGQLGRVLPPWDRTIEVVVFTHPDADHIGGLVDVLKQYEVKEIWMTGATKGTSIYAKFATIIDAKHIPTRVVQAGEQFPLPGFLVQILNPLQSVAYADTSVLNDTSIVAKVIDGRFSVLLTGDIEEAGQQKLLDAHADLSATILKVPHHGSKGADLDAFLRAVQPKLAIISVGAQNRYGHPHEETLQHYAALSIPLLRTDQGGMVDVSSDGQNVWIKTAKTGMMTRVELAQ